MVGTWGCRGNVSTRADPVVVSGRRRGCWGWWAGRAVVVVGWRMASLGRGWVGSSGLLFASLGATF